MEPLLKPSPLAAKHQSALVAKNHQVAHGGARFCLACRLRLGKRHSISASLLAACGPDTVPPGYLAGTTLGENLVKELVSHLGTHPIIFACYAASLTQKSADSRESTNGWVETYFMLQPSVVCHHTGERGDAIIVVSAAGYAILIARVRLTLKREHSDRGRSRTTVTISSDAKSTHLLSTASDLLPRFPHLLRRRRRLGHCRSRIDFPPQSHTRSFHLQDLVDPALVGQSFFSSMTLFQSSFGANQEIGDARQSHNQ